MSRSNYSIFILFVVSTFFSIPASSFEALPQKPKIPADNPQTLAKIELGKQLFFEPRLSQTGNISCNTCHAITGGGADNTRFSAGIEGKLGGRNSPTVWNSAFHTVQFWDGRALSLEDQAKGPMTNPVEMGMANHDLVVSRIAKIPAYRVAFEKIFSVKKTKGIVNINNIAKAIASFERTLITPNAPVDQYLRGNKKVLSASALRGMKLVEEIGCVACHAGPNYNAPVDQEMGVGFYQKFPTNTDNEFVKKYDLERDLGRFEVTKLDEDKHMWRVPTWRNVALTSPYFHNGSVATLDEAVRVMARTQLNISLKEPQVSDIVEFLTALTGEFPKITLPRIPDPQFVQD